MAKITSVIFILLPLVYYTASKPLDSKPSSFAEFVQDIKNTISEAIERVVEDIKTGLIGDLIKMAQHCENVTTIDDINIDDLQLSEQMNTVLHEEYEGAKQNYTSFEDYFQKSLFTVCQEINNSTSTKKST